MLPEDEVLDQQVGAAREGRPKGTEEHNDGGEYGLASVTAFTGKINDLLAILF